MKFTSLFAAGLSLAMLPLATDAAPAKKPAAKPAPAGKAAAPAAKGGAKTAAKHAPLTAAKCIKDMRAAVAFISKHARKDMNAKAKTERPFWSGLQLVTVSLKQMETGVKKPDAKYMKASNSLGEGAAEVTTAWKVLRKGYPKSQVGRGVVALAKATKAYRKNFGPEAARRKQGGKVSPKELAEITRQKAAIAKLQAQLAGIKGAPGFAPTMLLDLLHQCKALLGLDTSTLPGYLEFCHLHGVLQETFAAYSDCVEVWYPDAYAQWGAFATFSEIFALAPWWADPAFYGAWDLSTVSITSVGDYYESVIVESETTITEESTFISEYHEDTATEEDAEDSADIAESSDEAIEEDAESLEDEMTDGDADGDGTPDAEDMDDDNDGTPDTEDADDDGDGTPDAEDAADEPEEEAGEEPEMEEDSGDADAGDDSGDDAGGDDAGGDEQ